MVEQHHHGNQSHKVGDHARTENRWKSFLNVSRQSRAYPVLVGLLALISAGTSFYSFGPVLVAAIIIAPERWRSTYIAACSGAAVGATLLAFMVQTIGGHLIAVYFPGLEHSVDWLRADQLIRTYGILSLVAIAALPIPQLPPLLILALANKSPWLIGLAILVGKLCKYGLYILGVRLILQAMHRRQP